MCLLIQPIQHPYFNKGCFVSLVASFYGNTAHIYVPPQDSYIIKIKFNRTQLKKRYVISGTKNLVSYAMNMHGNVYQKRRQIK